MANIVKSTTRCIHCNAENPSMIGFGDTETLKSTQMAGNTGQCMECGKQMPIRKDLMTLTLEDGTVMSGKDL